MLGCSPQIPEALGSIPNITKAGENTLKTIKHSASVMAPLNVCKVTGWMVQELNKMTLMGKYSRRLYVSKPGTRGLRLLIALLLD